jgi:hypothetical protein
MTTVNQIMLTLAEHGKAHVVTDRPLVARQIFREAARKDGAYVRVDIVEGGINLRLRRFA